MAKGAMGRIGAWAFLVGIILAVIFAFVSAGSLEQWLVYLLIVIGLIIGLLNITEKEVQPFLIAGAILVIVTALGSDVVVEITYLALILKNIMLLFVPATIIVALKSVFSLAKN